jgi:hypothetical protein
MRARITILLTALAATGLIAAGCGDDDEETTSGATGATGATGEAALSKKDWITQADGICRRDDRELSQQAEETFGDEAPTEEEIVDFAEEVALPQTREQLAELRALPAPEGDQEEVDEILTAAEEGLAELEDDPSQFADPEGPTAFDEANRLAQDYGLEICGQE